MKTPIPSRSATLGVHLGQIRTRGDRPQTPKEWIISIDLSAEPTAAATFDRNEAAKACDIPATIRVFQS